MQIKNKNFMKPYYFAEIGLNHMGSKNNLSVLKEELLKKNIHGITIQILKEEFYKKKFKKFKLKDATIIKFIKDVKQEGKLIGIATNDISRINFLKKLNTTFENHQK